MERRKEPRFACNLPATLTVLGSESVRVPVTIENRSQSGMAIRVTRAIPLSVPVRIDAGDQLLLGEVCHCSAAGDGFLVGLRVEHVVRHLSSLMRLNDRLEAELGRSRAVLERSE